MKYYPLLIGEDCEAAFRFKQLNVKILDGPFNRIGITYERIISLLEDNLTGFIKKDNLHIEEKLADYPNSYGKCHRVVEKIDNKITVELWHNFHSSESFDVAYQKVSEEFSFSMSLFENTIKHDIRPIMFVHKKTDIPSVSDSNDLLNQYRKLRELIGSIRKMKFKIVALGHSPKFNENWGIENVESHQIQHIKLWGREEPEESWKKVIHQCMLSKIFL